MLFVNLLIFTSLMCFASSYTVWEKNWARDQWKDVSKELPTYLKSILQDVKHLYAETKIYQREYAYSLDRVCQAITTFKQNCENLILKSMNMKNTTFPINDGSDCLRVASHFEKKYGACIFPQD